MRRLGCPWVLALKYRLNFTRHRLNLALLDWGEGNEPLVFVPSVLVFTDASSEPHSSAELIFRRSALRSSASLSPGKLFALPNDYTCTVAVFFYYFNPDGFPIKSGKLV